MTARGETRVEVWCALPASRLSRHRVHLRYGSHPTFLILQRPLCWYYTQQLEPVLLIALVLQATHVATVVTDNSYYCTVHERQVA